MYGFVEIKPDKFCLFPGIKVLKAREYMSFLAAIELVKAARGKGDQIIAEAKEVYESEKKRGYEDGFEESKKNNIEEIHNTIKSCNEYYLKSEKVMTEVVFEAMKKIINDFSDFDLTLKIVRQALQAVSNQKQITLNVHPDQVGGLKSKIDDLLSGFPEIGYIDIVGDARIKRGGCILLTEIGIIDASIESQLKALKEAFTKSFLKIRANDKAKHEEQ